MQRETNFLFTKKQYKEDSILKKGEEELELLRSPLLLANTGILLVRWNRNSLCSGKPESIKQTALSSPSLSSAASGVISAADGKVIFSLSELPVYSEWTTLTGQTVDRISHRDVLVCDCSE